MSRQTMVITQETRQAAVDDAVRALRIAARDFWLAEQQRTPTISKWKEGVAEAEHKLRLAASAYALRVEELRQA